MPDPVLAPSRRPYGGRTTICITTLNRPAYLARTFEYFANEGFGGKILIGDGSRGREGEATKALVESFASRLDVEYIGAQDLHQPATMSLLADRVTTDFAVYTGDDDYLVPEGIADCEAFLNRHPDFVSAHGAGLVINANGVSGILESVEPYRVPELSVTDPIARLETFFARYGVMLFAVHRAEAWREMFRVTREMEDRTIGGEIAPCAVSALIGKCAEIPGLFLVRHIHPNRYHLPMHSEWIISPGFTESFGLLLAQLRELAGNLYPAGALPADAAGRIWRAAMGKMVRDFVSSDLPPPDTVLPSTDTPTELLPRLLDIEPLISGAHAYSTRFQKVLQSLMGPILADPRPRLLISWGNPYVLEDSIAPILPDLARKFAIVFFLVDLSLSKRVHDQVAAWKADGLIVDYTVLPGLGGNVQSHIAMRTLLPVIKLLDFDVFLSISASQPCERYILELALPEKCERILFWPHPTNLYLFDALGNALTNGASKASLNAIVDKIRRRVEPDLLKELLTPAPGWLAVVRALARMVLSSSPASKPDLPSPVASPAPAKVESTDLMHIADAIAAGQSPLRRFADLFPWLVPARKFVLGLAPVIVYRVELVIRGLLKKRGELKRAAARERQLRGKEMLGPWAMDWPEMRGFAHAISEVHFPYLLNHYIYPRILVGRTFPLQRLDMITHIGTSNFDALFMYSEDDAALHRNLYQTSEVFSVRYCKQVSVTQSERLNAVLFVYNLHSQKELTAPILELYARDMKICLRESGAEEMHVRPHPTSAPGSLDFFIDRMKSLGVPCSLVAADRPVTEAAAPYVGVLGGVSAALRDTRLACPDIFVVGSLGISTAHAMDPKRVIGFSDSIGWIEADGSFNPDIFRSKAADLRGLPTAADLLIRRYEARRRTGDAGAQIQI